MTTNEAKRILWLSVRYFKMNISLILWWLNVIWSCVKILSILLSNICLLVSYQKRIERAKNGLKLIMLMLDIVIFSL